MVRVWVLSEGHLTPGTCRVYPSLCLCLQTEARRAQRVLTPSAGRCPRGSSISALPPRQRGPGAPPVRNVSVLIPPAPREAFSLGLSVGVPDPTTTLASHTTRLLSRPSGAVVHVARRIAAAFGTLLLGCGLCSGLLGHDPFLPLERSCPRDQKRPAWGWRLSQCLDLQQLMRMNKSRARWASFLLFSAPLALSSLPSPASGFPTEGRELGTGPRSPSASGLRSGELSGVSTFSLLPPHLHLDANGLGKATGGSVVSAVFGPQGL